MTGRPGSQDPAAALTRLWRADMSVTFEADNPEGAAAIANRLLARVMEHPATWAAEYDFDEEQATEVVDV